jgi:RNA polymerase sigma-70 factor (ECF subfamily)
MRCGVSIAMEDTAAVETICAADASMDKASFLALYEENAPRLLAYIRRACGDAALADDILQETYCKLLRMPLPQLETHQWKAYLYRTATSLLTDHWRRTQRERRWSFLTRFEEQAPPANDLSPDMRELFETLKPQQQALL